MLLDQLIKDVLRYELELLSSRSMTLNMLREN